MIALLLLASEPVATPAEATRFEACADLAETDPVRALDEASTWRLAGGGVLARQCEGLAYVAQKRWAPAAVAFEAAAREAETKSDGRAALLWVQAGNAALAGNDPAKAAAYLDGALARGQLTGDALGEAHLDRARARAALGDLKGARTDLDLATKNAPADPLGWLLSATLARKIGDLLRAQTDISEAAKRSPDDASVALEAGNIAILSGNEDAARTAWEAAVKLSPESAAAKAATESLGRLAKPR
jgi:tetratricopeptide (TPR) repeat protein